MRGPLPGGLNAEARTDHARRAGADVFEEDLLGRFRFEERDVPRWIAQWGETIATGPGATLPGVLLTHQPGSRGRRRSLQATTRIGQSSWC